MKPFHLIAILHKDILEGRLTMDVFAADLWEVYKGRAVEDYQNPEIFFKKTYLTVGLRNLLNVASKRLRGEGGDPVIQIQTPFGGGKTHALIALYHAFTNPDSIKPYFDKALKANVVVIVGTALSPKEENGGITGTLWEEIERQLEGKVEKMSQPIAPGREALRELLEKHQPLLILMDEVLEYLAKAAGIKRGYTELKVGDTNLAAQTIAFMQELTETVKSLDRTLLVITLPSSVMEYPDEERAEELLTKLQKVAGRVEKIYSPVSGDEIYEVIRRRLFSRVDETEAKEIVDEYIDYYEREGIIIEKSEYREKMLKAYPFHPETIDVLHRRWGSLPTFQRTRGVLRILSLVVYRLRDSAVPLIRPCDFDLSFDELAEELIKHIGREYESVLRADITAKDSNAKKVDKTLGSTYQGLNLAAKLATTIFLYSFSGGEKGVTLGELKLACADINVPSSVITEVVEKLSDNLYYFWKEDGKFVFKSQPNLNKLLVSRMSEIEEPELKEFTKSLLQKYLGSTLPAYIWPRSSRDVPDTEEFKLVVLPQNDRKLVEEILNNYGENPRVYKNTVFFLVPMESEKFNFESWLRRRIAWEEIAKDKSLNLTEAQKKDVERNLKEVKDDERGELRKYYRIVYIPTREIKEIDLGLPIYKDKRPITKEILERLKAEKEIVEKLFPILIIEKYLGSRDYLELEQLYKSMLSTPGEPRITRENFIKSIKEGVKGKHFGFGYVRGSEVECVKFGEEPKITLQEFEAIIRKELCEKEKVIEEEVTDVVTKPKPTKVVEEQVQVEVKEKVEEEAKVVTVPEIKHVILEVKIPGGKFSDFYRGVLSVLEDNFDDVEVTIRIDAKEGKISKSDYENKIKETLIQINAQILKEHLKE
ncbi:AAA family ATPase [Archaeoglobales archaeon]|nr:MAG: AAA family ATPase [Archaeoglobales archaeon]